MTIRFGLTPLALAMAILAGNHVHGQEHTPPENPPPLTSENGYVIFSDTPDCCAEKQQGGDCCAMPCSKTGCCSKTKAASGKKCCDKDCCDKCGDSEGGCCTGISCSTGKCGFGCCIKADCSACKTSKCCQAKSCRAMGCCAAAMVRMVVPVPPLPVLMPLPLPPLPTDVFLSVVRLRSAHGTHCPYCQMMGLCPRQSCVKATTAVRSCGSRPGSTPRAVYFLVSSGYPEPVYGYCKIDEVSGRSYVVEVRRMEKVGRQVRESRPCPDVSVQADRPERVQIAGELILGDAGLTDRSKDTEEPNRSMLDLLVHPCGVDKVCLGLETDQLQPPSQACFGVGFRRCMRLVKTLELGKPTRVVLERDCKGNERSWLEITVRNPELVPSADGKKVSTAPPCGSEASELHCPRQALENSVYPTLAPRPVGQPCPGAACVIQPWAPVTPPPPPPCAAPMQSVWLPPQPIPPPAPPVPTAAPLPPPLPVASSPEPMPPPAPIQPPVPTVMPYGPTPPLPDVATVASPCPTVRNELRCVELSVVEEKGKQMLRLESGDMRLTCEQITLERKGQGKVTLCASGSQVCLHGKVLKARADRVKVEDATTFSLLGKVQVHTDLSSPGSKGVVSETRGDGPAIRVNMMDGGISIRQMGP